MIRVPVFNWPRLLEASGALAVLFGLVNLVIFFGVHGYLPAPFVFDTNDTFMDWFHTAYWAHNPGAYTVWKSIYLPLSFVITNLFADPRCYATSAFDARDCDLIGIAALLLAYVGSVAVSALAFYRNDASTALFRSLAVAAGGPLLFALERGNLIMIAYIAFVLLYGGLLKSKFAVAAVAGFMINMKIYLLLPVLTFALKRQWRTLELCGFAAIGLYLVSLVIVGHGTPFQLASNLQGWFGASVISIWDQVVFSTTYMPYLLLDAFQYPVRDFVDQRTVDAIKVFIEYEVIASRTLAIVCLIAAFFYPATVSLQRLVFFMLMQSFIVQNPGGYAIAMIVFLVFMETRRNLATAVAIGCAYLVSIPSDISLATIVQVERVSWLGGQLANVDYVLTLGAVVRPGLFVLMLWALAIDTLIDLHRTAKAGPPMLALGRSPPFGAQLTPATRPVGASAR